MSTGDRRSHPPSLRSEGREGIHGEGDSRQRRTFRGYPAVEGRARFGEGVKGRRNGEGGGERINETFQFHNTNNYGGNTP